MNREEVRDILGNLIRVDFDKHGELLEMIRSICQQFEEKHDFSQDILAMPYADTIPDLIRTYNNIIKLLTIKFYGRRTVPRDWYIYERWGRAHNKYVYEIGNCLNESLLEWYKRQDHSTDEPLKQAIVNLRNSENRPRIQNMILNIAGATKNEEILLLSIDRNKHCSYRTELYSYQRNNSILKEYIYLSKVLGANGHVFDLVEISFGERKNIDYKVLASEYEKELEEEEIARKEEMKKRKRKNKSYSLFDPDDPVNKAIDTIGGGLFSIILSLPFAFLGAIFGGMNKRR